MPVCMPGHRIKEYRGRKVGYLVWLVMDEGKCWDGKWQGWSWAKEVAGVARGRVRCGGRGTWPGSEVPGGGQGSVG